MIFKRLYYIAVAVCRHYSAQCQNTCINQEYANMYPSFVFIHYIVSMPLCVGIIKISMVPPKHQIRYQGITCKNQPKSYFSVGLKYRSTVDGKIPSRYFSVPGTWSRENTVLYNKEKINPVALTVDFVLPFRLKNQIWLVVESRKSGMCVIMVKMVVPGTSTRYPVVRFPAICGNFAIRTVWSIS